MQTRQAPGDTVSPPGQLQTRLANERTLLAWLRTAIALMGFGVMIARLGVFLDSLTRTTGVPSAAAGHSRWTGTLLLLTGSVVAAVGQRRTHAYALAIDPERLPPSNRPLAWTSWLVVLLGVALAAFVLGMK